jgi:hypothetical protein
MSGATPNEAEEKSSSPNLCSHSRGNENALLRFGRLFSRRGDETLSSEPFNIAGTNGHSRHRNERKSARSKTSRGKTPEAGAVIFRKTACRSSLYKGLAVGRRQTSTRKAYVSYL